MQGVGKLIEAPERYKDIERNRIVNRCLTDLEEIINHHNPEIDTPIKDGVWNRLDKMALEIEARAEADTLRAEVARLREALCFYAEKAFWHDGGIDFSSYENCADLVLSTIEVDNGETARAALAHGEADQ
jgi:hypothetical protein